MSVKNKFLTYTADTLTTLLVGDFLALVLLDPSLVKEIHEVISNVLNGQQYLTSR